MSPVREGSFGRADPATHHGFLLSLTPSTSGFMYSLLPFALSEEKKKNGAGYSHSPKLTCSRVFLVCVASGDLEDELGEERGREADGEVPTDKNA